MMRRLASLFKNIFVLSVTVLLTLGGLEGLFRLFRPNDALALSMGRMDPHFHHSLKPGDTYRLLSPRPGEYNVRVRINRFGFRGPEIDFEKKPGQRRVMLVGDSFTFGVGAEEEETIPALLQRHWDPAGEKIQVVNAGVGASSPVLYYLRLRDYLLEFRPDLVVLMLDFSDLREDWYYEKKIERDRDGRILRINPYFEDGRFHVWNYLVANSVFFKYLHNKCVRTFQKIQKLGLAGYLKTKWEGKKSKVVIAREKEDTIAFDGRIFLRGSEKADEIRRHFERTGRYLLMCKSLLDERRIPLVLVLYPYGIHVGGNQWAIGRKSWGFEEGKLYEDDFSFKLVEAFAEKNGIPFINLLGALRLHNNEVLYFPADGHFTPAANRVVAESLAAHPLIKDRLK